MRQKHHNNIENGQNAIRLGRFHLQLKHLRKTADNPQVKTAKTYSVLAVFYVVMMLLPHGNAFLGKCIV